MNLGKENEIQEFKESLSQPDKGLNITCCISFSCKAKVSIKYLQICQALYCKNVNRMFKHKEYFDKYCDSNEIDLKIGFKKIILSADDKYMEKLLSFSKAWENEHTCPAYYANSRRSLSIMMFILRLITEKSLHTHWEA